MAKIQITISAENAQAVAALKQVAEQARQSGESVKKAGSGAGFDSATKSAGGFLDKLSKVTIVGAGIVAVLREIKDAAAAIVGPGFNFNKTMEQNQLGMAGILQSMTLIDGKAVDFNQAMAISSDMMKKLQQDAMRTAASTEDLVEVFRAILAPGLNAGMTLDQVRQTAVVGTNAVKSLGIPHQQIVQEMRDLVQGGITASGSTLATALGLTDADIEKAKNSSDGLFKFLMDRMKGFDETTKKFPDTMQGRMDQLEEVFTQGSAKFASKFEEPIKEGLSAISDSIGEVDEKTGEIHLNPAFASAADEVNGILTDMKSLAKDLAPSFSWIGDDVVPACKDLWGSLKDIGSMIGDSLRIVLKETKPVIDWFAQGFRDLAHDIKEATGWLANWFDVSARKAGVRSQDSGSMAEFRHSEDTNTKPPVSSSSDDVKAKYQDNKKAVENSQAALKIALDVISANAKQAVAEIKKEQESIEVLFKQSMISAEEYARRKAELDMKIQQVAVDEAQQKLEATQGTQYDKDNEKNVAVSKANEELNTEIEKLKDFGASLDDVNKAINAMTGASDTWRKEVDNVNIDGLKDNAKAAINALADYFYQQTGQQMVVSSGLRTWESHPNGPGGHISGTKFDVVDAGDSNLLEKNVNGIRDKLIAYAQSLGIKILNAYAGDEGPDAPGHLDFNAKDFTATFTAQAKTRIGRILTKSGLEYLNAILELMGEADEIVKSLAESRGDVSSRQKAELVAKYNDLIKKFQVNGMTDAVKNVQELQKAEFLKLDFSQAQKNLELANGQLVETQESLLNDLASGTKTAADVTDEYSVQYKAKTDKIVTELQRIIKDAGDNTELSNSAKALLRQIMKSVNDFADKVIQRIDAELQNEIAMINADRNLTSMQKQDRIDEATRKAYADKAAREEEKAQGLRALDLKNNNNDNAATIIDLEKTAALYRKLSEFPTLLDKIHQTSRQAFEDGLLTFLTEGITQCKNLGEAFRNLAITVLQSIQKVYAEAMTKNIMTALGFGSYSNQPSSSGSTYKFPTNIDITKPLRFAEGGSTIDNGEIKGPGTSTSDSILAWVQNIKKWIRVGNGEWIMKGEAVRKYGTRVMDAINSGRVPVSMLQRYAIGGSLTNRNIASIPGPQELAASLINSNSTTIPLSIANFIDPGTMSKFIKTREGKRALLNYIKDDAGTIKRILKI